MPAGSLVRYDAGSIADIDAAILDAVRGHNLSQCVTAAVIRRGRIVVIVRRGDVRGGKAEPHDRTNEVSVAPNGGYGFGPRHLDFHPTKPWVYVSLERQNRLDVFAFHDTTLLAVPVFQTGTLAEPDNIRGRQAAGTVHVHPKGHVVYVANRASSTVPADGRQVFAGGDNVNGADLVVTALADGRRAASAMAEYLAALPTVAAGRG